MTLSYLVEKRSLEGEVRCKIESYSRCGVCGQGILRCKCGIVNWKYVTVGVGGNNLIWQMLCVWSGDTEM